MEKSYVFAVFFKEKGKVFNLICFLLILFGFMLIQIIWNFLRWVWGFFSVRLLNVGNKCIKLDLSLKFILLLMFMYNGWFFTLGAVSFLSVCCRVTVMVLRWIFFFNLRKVFFILRLICIRFWLVERVTGINN